MITKVLMIGQLPKEAGGNYTTGAAKVLYELSKQHTDDVLLFTFATNASDKALATYCRYKNEYIGYRYLIGSIVADFLSHPWKTMKEWRHYRNVEHENPLRYALYKANIKRAIILTKPDVIHVHSISNVSPVRFALGKATTPVLLTCHGIFYRGEEKSKLRDIHLGNIKFADYYSGLTKESRDEYDRFLGIDKEKVTVIPNGVDCKKFFYDTGKRMEIRKLYGVRPDETVFITVASVQERKGQFAFVKLLSNIKMGFQYWIVGSGPDIPLIESFVKSNNLEDRVKLLGYKNSDELYAYYSAADVYAHVSSKEGQALCEIEARATGMRVAVNKLIIGTIPKMDESNYYILDMDNLQLESFASWCSIKQEDRKSNTSMDWSVVANMYGDLYKDIINNQKK